MSAELVTAFRQFGLINLRRCFGVLPAGFVTHDRQGAD